MLEKELIGKDTDGKNMYRYGNFVYLYKGKKPEYNRNVHTVIRVTGEWPTEAELIHLMDTAPFGGRIHWVSGNEAEISIHTD